MLFPGMLAAALAIVPAEVSVAPGGSQIFRLSGPALVTWSVESAPPPRERTRFPLRISDDGRYLVDAAGRPWRVQADAAWFMSIKSTPVEIERYLSVRQEQGFDAFYLMAVVHPGGYPSAPDAPANLQGDVPFATSGKFTTAGASPASERYWAAVDAIIDRAAAHDMAVMFAYTYLGWGGGKEGWYQEVLEQPSRADCRAWGRWLGNRYRDRPNLIWFALGDFTPPPGSEGEARELEIARGIREAGAKQLFMAEPSGPDGLPVLGTMIDINSFYGYGPQGGGLVYLTADRAFRAQPIRPAFMQEGTYEFENNTGAFRGDPVETRRGRFWSVLGGGTAGDGFGSREAWQWRDLPSSLYTPGARYSSAAFALFASLPWWELRPLRGNENPILSGAGTWGAADRVTVAATVTREWLLAYLPPIGAGERTLKIDLRGLAAPARARWFDPATGNYLPIHEEHELPPTGTATFKTPGSRADGSDDWVLVLDTSSARCGTIDSSGRYTAPGRAPPDVSCQVVARAAGDSRAEARADLRFR